MKMKKIIYIAVVLLFCACETNFPTWEAYNTDWLKQNETKLGFDPEVIDHFILPSGVQCEVYHNGYGAVPKPSIDPVTGVSSLIEIKYVGSLPDNVVFDKTDSTTAFLYLSDCIPGWQQALGKMKQGSHWKIYIPSTEGYGTFGSKDAYGNYVIPPHSTLIFDIELVDVVNY